MNERTIEDRLGKLEKSNRRLKAGLAVCAAALLAAVVIGAERAAQPLIATEHIRLMDADGKLRVGLGSDKDGTFLFLNDETGKMRASIAAQSRQVYLNLKDGEGKTRLVLLCDEAGPSVKLRDADGITVAALATDAEGGMLQITDADGKLRVIGTLSDVITEPKAEPAKE